MDSESDLGDDRPQLRWETNFQFSTRSAYAFLNRKIDSRQSTTWKKVWQLKVPQRVKVFAWLPLHERLLTNLERVRWHSAESGLCEICKSGREDIEHVLRSYIAANWRGKWVLWRTSSPEEIDLWRNVAEPLVDMQNPVVLILRIVARSDCRMSGLKLTLMLWFRRRIAQQALVQCFATTKGDGYMILPIFFVTTYWYLSYGPSMKAFFMHGLVLAARGRASKLSTDVFTVAPDDVREVLEEEMSQSALTSDSLVSEFGGSYVKSPGARSFDLAGFPWLGDSKVVGGKAGATVVGGSVVNPVKDSDANVDGGEENNCDAKVDGDRVNNYDPKVDFTCDVGGSLGVDSHDSGVVELTSPIGKTPRENSGESLESPNKFELLCSVAEGQDGRVDSP
ncbi:hypothetical protein V6N12_050868 [Hibiscus sabdariffa]|uniref:Reverse transcriptase zinc-binding domain-containing protein n=1 Tax=Hibiscus sabdariffa TaxID=183260 RepID=A0ABR2GDU1_9ROSI